MGPGFGPGFDNWQSIEAEGLKYKSNPRKVKVDSQQAFLTLMPRSMKRMTREGASILVGNIL